MYGDLYIKIVSPIHYQYLLVRHLIYHDVEGWNEQLIQSIIVIRDDEILRIPSLNLAYNNTML